MIRNHVFKWGSILKGDLFAVAAKRLEQDKEVTTSLFKEVEGKSMSEFCPRKQGVSRGLTPNLLILNKGAITSLSLLKLFSSNKVGVVEDFPLQKSPNDLVHHVNS